MQTTILQLNILAQLSVDKIEERAQHQFHHASVTSDSTVGRKNTCSEIFFTMHRAEHTNEYFLGVPSVFDFHSRMKSIFVSFSRFPILYHRRREFGGCKSPFSRLSRCCSRTQHTAAPYFLPSHNKNTETRESSVLVFI